MNLDFSAPQNIKGELIQFAKPDKGFWIAWRTAKDSLLSSGIFVRKLDNIFYVCRKVSSTGQIKKTNVIPYEITKTRPKLLYYQHKIVGELIASLISHRIGIDGSDAGIGKTYHAIAVCAELNKKPAIITTKTNIVTWFKVCNFFGVTPIFITNWESIIARKIKGNYVCNFPFVDIKKNPYSGQMKYVWKLPLRNDILIIFDECHKGTGDNTSQGKVFLASKPYNKLLLSATLAESPYNFKNIGLLAGLYTEFNFNSWLVGLGNFKGKYGWQSVSVADDMQTISKMIFPKFGNRVRKIDIPDFPDIQNIAESYNIPDVNKFNEAYDNFMFDLEETENTRQKLIEIKEKETTKSKVDLIVKKIRELQANKLVLNLRYRQLTEFLKIPVFVDLVKENLDNGFSVAVFVNFTETLLELSKKLKTSCLVHGGQTGSLGLAERNKAIENFQVDRQRVIICNIAAGGIGISLHDLNGNYPRVAIISPTYSAKQLVQVLGRIHRSGAKSKAINRLVYANNTVEVDVCSAVSEKIDAINALNDADLAEKDIFNLMRNE
jgi:superfamily II DNA or RNA helicase